MHFAELRLNRDSHGKLDLSDPENLSAINKFVLPVISGNAGWGTSELTRESFNADPENYRTDLQGTLGGSVHILMVEEQPVALMEYETMHLAAADSAAANLVREMLADHLNPGWSELANYLNIADQKLSTEVAQTEGFLFSRPIYHSIGIVVRADLQGKRSGYSQQLYERLRGGFFYGWTSNPVIVHMRRKLFANTLYLPPRSDTVLDPESLAVCMLVYCDWKTHPSAQREGLEFGALYSEYFNETRGEEYLVMAQGMHAAGKLSDGDLANLEYVMAHKHCAGAIVSWDDSTL